MKLVNTEDVSAVAKRLTVEIDRDQVAKSLDRIYKRVGRQARLKGFRPGKVPRSVLERHYGPQVKEEAAAQLIEASFAQAVEESGLKPVVRPQAEPGVLDGDAPYRYTLLVEIAPEVDIDGYFGLELERREKDITEEMVADKLEEIRQVHATLEAAPADRPAAEGDTVLVDFEASRDGRPVEGGALTGFDIRLGQGRFHPEAESALAGLTQGETATATVAFPADFFLDALAGQEVDLTIHLKEVRRTVLPELDDDFAKSLGDSFESLADLKDKIREQMTEAAKRDADRLLQDQLMDRLLEKTDFEVPEGLVNQELGRLIQQVERSLMMRGLSMEAAGINPAKLEEDLRPQALRRCQEDLILEAIAAKEGIEVEEQDLQEGFEELGRAAGQSPDEVRKVHEDNNLLDSFKAGLLRRKTLNRLLAEANIQVETVSD